MSGSLVTCDDVRDIIRAPSISDDQIRSMIEVAHLIVTEEIGSSITVTVSSDRLKLIEKFLSAHYVSLIADETRLKSIAVGGANGSAMTVTDVMGKGLEFTRYGMTAMSLDPTGRLQNLDRKKSVFESFSATGRTGLPPKFPYNW